MQWSLQGSLAGQLRRRRVHNSCTIQNKQECSSCCMLCPAAAGNNRDQHYPCHFPRRTLHAPQRPGDAPAMAPQ